MKKVPGLGKKGPGWQPPRRVDSCLNIVHKVDLMKSFLLGTSGSVILVLFFFFITVN